MEGWKTNSGRAKLEDIPLTERYKLWVDECSKLFGGMDILAVDVIRSSSSSNNSSNDNSNLGNSSNVREWIIEINDTSIGLSPSHEEEDMELIRDLTLQRMREAFSGSYYRTSPKLRY